MNNPDPIQFKHDIISKIAKQIPFFDVLSDYAAMTNKSEKAHVKYKFEIVLYDYIADDHCKYKISTIKFRKMLNVIKDTIVSCLYYYVHRQYRDTIEYFINMEMIPKAPFISSTDRYYLIRSATKNDYLSMIWCLGTNYIEDHVNLLIKIFDDYRLFGSFIKQDSLDEFMAEIRDTIISDLDNILYDQYCNIYNELTQLYRNEYLIQNAIFYDEERRQYYNSRVGYLSYGTYTLHSLINYFCGAYIEPLIQHKRKTEENIDDLLDTTKISINTHSSIFDIITKINYYCNMALIIVQSQYPHVIPKEIASCMKNDL